MFCKSWNNWGHVKPLLNKFLFSKICTTRCQTLYTMTSGRFKEKFVKLYIHMYLQFLEIPWNQSPLIRVRRSVTVWKLYTGIHSRFFSKNFGKVMVLLKKLLNSWFDKFLWWVNFSFDFTEIFERDRILWYFSTAQCSVEISKIYSHAFLTKFCETNVFTKGFT